MEIHCIMEHFVQLLCFCAVTECLCAHRRARAEEARLKAAQQQVAAQLAKITNVEASMD